MIRLVFIVFLLQSLIADGQTFLHFGAGYVWYKFDTHERDLKIENQFNYKFEIGIINSINKKNHEINFGLSFWTENYQSSDLGYTTDSTAVIKTKAKNNFIGPHLSYLI